MTEELSLVAEKMQGKILLPSTNLPIQQLKSLTFINVNVQQKRFILYRRYKFGDTSEIKQQ